MEDDIAYAGSDLEGTALVYEECPGSDVLHVFGDFWFGNAAHVEQSLVRNVHIGRTTVCNLTNCSYLDAAGAGVLCRARRALGSSFAIVAPETGIVRRVLELTHLVSE